MKTDRYVRPKWHKALCMFGFVASISHINFLAEEISQTFKLISSDFNIPTPVLGFTLFAFGNCIGDIVNNLMIAKMGFSGMAVGACFGGPMLNILLGVGIGTLYANLKHGKDYEISLSPSLISSSFYLLIILLISMISIPLNGNFCFLMKGWKGDKKYGILLIICYILGTTVNIVLSFKGI